MTFCYGSYYCELAYSTQRFMIWNKILGDEELIGYIESDGCYPNFRSNPAKRLYTANDLNAVIHFIEKVHEGVPKA